ncbi:indolepyruvate ferredoxin oxidoreductase family protein [Sandaracinobacter sp. RS1-74]|uniref:indolepyruvate ferredoxin oxidoreductase family protein n=1 Tax=Sandaracinobacteroides sayramensis TaxID=2913411 RepID=UPI001EDB6BEB|nr:indolepyruvate ferredoxin oxidoreductase family protein [Sandaracinobacteroides sayramensis]MCG2840904.1 indolepyruvate ferredoxin oxidoreductase family protein [Sandaracinobacteroides sayramensis]
MTKTAVRLDDKYTQSNGRIYISSNQALVRLPMMQRQRDLAAGLNTAGYITGYRGSPLGIYDSNLWAASELLKENHIRFQPGVNEELALTSIRGTQWLHYYNQASYDGIFSIWYAKNLGVDRAFEVMRQANLEGSARNGGVLVIGGDDTGGKSTVTATSSDPVWKAALMPILYPANTQEYLDFGLLGWAMSRYAGVYTAFKAVTDTIERTSTVDIDPSRSMPVLPDFKMPPGGLNKIKGDIMPLPIERRMVEFKLPAAQAFVRANGIDRVIFDSDRRELGIISAGKPYLDVREALNELGIDERRARALGIRLYKPGMTFPLEPEGATAFARRHREILVIEEKSAFVEEQLVSLLYAMRADERPEITGKQDTAGKRLVPDFGETSVHLVIDVLIARIEALDIADEPLKARIARIRESRSKVHAIKPTGLMRTAFFCSGCPHNSSTRTVDGSLTFAGVGCHGLSAMFMPDRPTEWAAQMGGEGMLWAGLHAFIDVEHAFQNIGDGTYFHSGLLAIRAAVASGATMTYKLLYNDAVAMTGGQPIDGTLTVEAMANQVYWEGVKPIVVVTDEPEKYPADIRWPEGTTVRHRRELEEVQREMQKLPGVSAIIYDQTCAAEKRRRRKRGKFPNPPKRVFINEDVCEGCGDCSKKSNCVSVQPVETEFGRKRKIDQSSCNKDFSCQDGFCPSFVSVIGGEPRKFGAAFRDEELKDVFAAIPEPAPRVHDRVYNILLTGIGGTGVLTVAAIAGMAAHLDNRGASVMDMTGMAQKGGGVLSHIRIAPSPEDLHAPRLWNQSADLVIGCDMVVTASPGTLDMVAPETEIIVNTEVVPTAQFQANNAISFGVDTQLELLRSVVGQDRVDGISATHIATKLMGDSITTNMFMLGYAVQKGFVPLSISSIEEAIKLNGSQVKSTLQVFNWGRLAAHDPALLQQYIARTGIHSTEEPLSQDLEGLIARRVVHLTDYQNASYARQYSDFVEKVRAAETAAGLGGNLLVTQAVARYLSKLMSYKDEYEVARLYSGPAFRDRLSQSFEGDYKLRVQLAPPVLARPAKPGGEPKKIEFGPWIFSAFRLMAGMKGLRGGMFDIFGKTAERRMERRLIEEYRNIVEQQLPRLNPGTQQAIADIAALPEMVKGYGPIKEANVVKYEAEMQRHLAALDAPVLAAA